MNKKTNRNTDIYKSDSSEMEKRINIVYLMILQGFQRKQIIQYCSDEFKVGERQTDEYLKQARKIVNENILDDSGLKKNEIINQLYDLYQKNYNLEDYRECRNILAQISDIFGVRAPIKTDITSGGEKIQSSPTAIQVEIVRSNETTSDTGISE
jgi:hypothetical protein